MLLLYDRRRRTPAQPPSPTSSTPAKVRSPFSILVVETEPGGIEQRRPQPVSLSPRQICGIVDDDAAEGLSLPPPHHTRLAVVDAKSLLDHDCADTGDEEP
jgi:hypothetical protein